MEIVKNDLKDGDIVYGCAFKIDFDRTTHYQDSVVHNKCEPVKGIIKGRQFYVLKKDGTPRKSGAVSIWARRYTKTYEESVELYNRLITLKQENLRSIADGLESDKIVIESED